MPPLDPAVTRSSAYGFLRVARQDRVHRLVRAERELGHVRLGQHDRAGVFDRLRTWNASLFEMNPLSDSDPVGALQADRLEVVLHDRRDAVQRTGQSALREAAIQLVGLLSLRSD